MAMYKIVNLGWFYQSVLEIQRNFLSASYVLLYFRICWAEELKKIKNPVLLIFLGVILAEGLEDLTMKSNYSGRAFEEQAMRTRQASLEQHWSSSLLFPLPTVSVWRNLCFQSFSPLDPRYKLFSCCLISGKAAAGGRKKRIQASFNIQWIICVFGEDNACPTLFPGCFQPHQILSREAPGAHYFAGTGCYYLPMCGFRDWSHLKILSLTLGYVCTIHICSHTIYTSSHYLCTFCVVCI